MRLLINIDHIATLRQARGGTNPDPLKAVALCEKGGADGIVAHLREDRRHIQDTDVWSLREVLKGKYDLEMAATEEIIQIALKVKPDLITLVPEKRMELTTEGGIDVRRHKDHLQKTIRRFHDTGIPVSLFVEPDLDQISLSKEIGADCVELHTGTYADAPDVNSRERALQLLREAARHAGLQGLIVNCGHGLNYSNVAPIAALREIEELSIGHAIISRSVFSGLEQSVRDMVTIIKNTKKELP